jgi:hypothetical protein
MRYVGGVRRDSIHVELLRSTVQPVGVAARSHGPINVSQRCRGPRDARPGRSADQVQTIAAGSLVQVRSR